MKYGLRQFLFLRAITAGSAPQEHGGQYAQGENSRDDIYPKETSKEEEASLVWLTFEFGYGDRG